MLFPDISPSFIDDAARLLLFCRFFVKQKSDEPRFSLRDDKTGSVFLVDLTLLPTTRNQGSNSNNTLLEIPSQKNQANKLFIVISKHI